MEELKIIKCQIVITWIDGLQEDISPDLPEFLAEEMEIYLDELTDLRNENPEEYNVSEMEHQK